METKTNVMRILDAHHIPYHEYCYIGTGAVSGIDVANVLGQNPNQVFKSLVTVSKEKRHYVFLVPVAKRVGFKKMCQSSIRKEHRDDSTEGFIGTYRLRSWWMFTNRFKKRVSSCYRFFC